MLLRRGGAESFARGEKGGGLQCGVADISPLHDPAQCGRNGKIVAVGEVPGDATTTIDARNRVVSPGLDRKSVV